jgi:hypothetical protein
MSGTPDYTQQAVIYRLGYPNMGNNGYSSVNPPGNADAGGLDPKVKATLMRWGNYDFQSDSARWEAGEIPPGVPVPPDHTLPASLYLASKPPWWCDSIPWPAIGPDVAGLTHDIPAKRRYEARPCGPSAARPYRTPVPENQPVIVAIYDLCGRKVAMFRHTSSGPHGYARRLQAGKKLSSGMYLAHVSQRRAPALVSKLVTW